MSITFQPDTEARLLESAHARGKTPDEVVTSLLDLLPAEAGEVDLLREINLGFSQDFWSRYRTLAARRQAETLTPDEQAELITLSDQVEERTLRRTQALVELATQRNVSLDGLLQQLGIHPQPVTS